MAIGQIIFLLLNGISIVKNSMLTIKKSSLARTVYSGQEWKQQWRKHRLINMETPTIEFLTT